ncbi:MAG: M15 family metallopeptidase, partial [Clostridium sp.]|nr:M15 family metallopeptidase [Clostridium sp.]
KDKIFIKELNTDSIILEKNTQIDNNEIHKENDDEQLQQLLKIKNDPLMILVNKDNTLDSDYIPEDLVLSEIDFVSYIETRNLAKVTADAAKEMFEAAAKEGIVLLGASGYRSYFVQENLYNSRVINEGQEEADRYTAKPGQSEHQTGLALDILSEDYQEMDDNFDSTEAYAWLKNNCYKYGFILRYIDGKEDITGFLYEPWHYRYIGNKEVAEYIMERNLTFEQYMEELDIKIQELS